MNHRDRVKIQLEEFLKDKDITGWKILEIGPREDRTFADIFRSKGAGWRGIDLDIYGDDVVYGSMDNMEMIEDNEVDMVFSCHAFEHCKRPVDALREIARVSKKFVFMATPYPCAHQILNADNDHIFCLIDMQMIRLFHYTKIKPIRVEYQMDSTDEQDFDLISIGEII